MSDDDLHRLISYAKYNVYFELAQNQVREMGLFNPQFDPPRFENEKSAGSASASGNPR
jgi:hypothetical protein